MIFSQLKKNAIAAAAVFIALLSLQLRWCYFSHRYDDLILRLAGTIVVSLVFIPIYLHYIRTYFSKVILHEEALHRKINVLHLPLFLFPVIIVKAALMP